MNSRRRLNYKRIALGLLATGLLISPLPAQIANPAPDHAAQPDAATQPDPANVPDKTPPEPQSKHVLFIVPNFRTAPIMAEYKPISAREKFRIAGQDSWDRGTVALAAAFAGEAQLSNANPSFGQGVEGYAHYFATAYADFVIGNYMTEAIFPVILHQDPRYFRKGSGSGVGRLGYAASQIFWTHNDSGRGQFNYSEIGGNSAAVAISMSYYPENRDVGDAVSKLGSQIAVDMASNILKEFWPDIAHKFSHKHKSAADTGN